MDVAKVVEEERWTGHRGEERHGGGRAVEEERWTGHRGEERHGRGRSCGGGRDGQDIVAEKNPSGPSQ